jgi:hypothetical protein
MLEKRQYLVIAFHTTAAALAMERLCRRDGIPGRLIPVPREITADCGMAWRTETGYEATLRSAADAAGLEFGVLASHLIRRAGAVRVIRKTDEWTLFICI